MDKIVFPKLSIRSKSFTEDPTGEKRRKKVVGSLLTLCHTFVDDAMMDIITFWFAYLRNVALEQLNPPDLFLYESDKQMWFHTEEAIPVLCNCLMCTVVVFLFRQNACA